MPEKKPKSDRFAALTLDSLKQWVGKRIFARGRSYQQDGLVSDLAVTDDGDLIAWVDGSDEYATRVSMSKNDRPESICTCPYELDCKHGVAVVLEYFEQIESARRIPKVKKDDERLGMLEDGERYGDGLYDEEDDEDTSLPDDVIKEIDEFLEGKTGAQLVKLIHELAEKYPEVGQDLADRCQIVSGDVKSIVTRLRKEIREVGEEYGWHNDWQGVGYTLGYDDICVKLENLLRAGYADEVLALGKELIEVGIGQIELSYDDGETAMEIESCIPVVARALERSSLDIVDRLVWAVDVLFKDEFGFCDDFFIYLQQKHPKAAWNSFADRLLKRLDGLKGARNIDDFSRNYTRDKLSDWVIRALERAGRKDEIIPLCEAEAEKTGSYTRLVELLIKARRWKEAEKWIQEGIRVTEDSRPGSADQLRARLRKIHSSKKNWSVVAAMQVEEFVRAPFHDTFTDCKKAAGKIKVWEKIRGHLLTYMESGKLPWEQKGWPLPETGLKKPGNFQDRRFPMIIELIDIGILEKKPDQVLRWYDKLSKGRRGWSDVDEDEIAMAVQSYAPERSVAIWKDMAEQLISQVKPSAYREAAEYLRGARRVMVHEKKLAEWNMYIKELRTEHARKRRLMEILDNLERKPDAKRR